MEEVIEEQKEIVNEEQKTEEKDKKQEEKDKKQEEKDRKKEEKEKRREEKEKREAKKREEKQRKKEEKRKKKEAKSSSAKSKTENSQNEINNSQKNDLSAFTDLPENFYEKIVLLEMDLSEEFTIDKLTSLIKLYSMAMAKFEKTEPAKAKQYKGRMEHLLTDFDTMKKLKKQSENIGNASLNNNVSNKNTKTEMNKTLEIVKLKTDNVNFDDIQQKINSVLVDNQPLNRESVKNIINDDIEKQNVSWKDKLQKKKKNALMRNTMGYNQLKSSKISIGGNKRSTLTLSSSTNDKLGRYSAVNQSNKLSNMIKNNNEDNNSNTIKEDIYEDIKAEDEKNDENEKKNEDEKKNKDEEIRIARKKSIVDENVIQNVNMDESILKSVNQRMDLLMELIDKVENNNNNLLEEESEDEDEEESDNNQNKINDKEENNYDINISNIKDVPARFQSTYYQVENIMSQYMDQFNNFYYKEIFEHFSSKLKEVYDSKYKNYIETANEYHDQIKKNEHILQNEDNLTEEKKNEIQNIIDSLKEEQQNQIAKIEDEFNRMIVSEVKEFKINSFKNNSGIQLMEEQLKLEIYSLINDAFF